MESPIVLRKQSVKRCLFGVPDPVKTKLALSAITAMMDKRDSATWNFNFQTGTPITGPGTRYEWETTTNVPVAYKMRDLEVGCCPKAATIARTPSPTPLGEVNQAREATPVVDDHCLPASPVTSPLRETSEPEACENTPSTPRQQTCSPSSSPSSVPSNRSSSPSTSSPAGQARKRKQTNITGESVLPFYFINSRLVRNQISWQNLSAPGTACLFTRGLFFKPGSLILLRRGYNPVTTTSTPLDRTHLG